eukprot:6121056-Pleurochrysis_carterae.AAC.2
MQLAVAATTVARQILHNHVFPAGLSNLDVPSRTEATLTYRLIRRVLSGNPKVYARYLIMKAWWSIRKSNLTRIIDVEH